MIYKKFLSLFAIFTNILFASSLWDFSAFTTIENESFLKTKKQKHDQSLTIKQNFEINFKKDNINFFTKLYAQADIDDTKISSQKTKRSFVRIDEIYFSKEFDDGLQKFLFGKKIRYWGALEAKNITDVFNLVDLRNQRKRSDKLGVLNSQYSYFTDNGEFSLIIKHYEQDQKISASSYAYYLLPTNISFNETLNLQKNRTYPTTYLLYTASNEWKYPLDYTLILQHGYDSQKYYTKSKSAPIVVQPNAYLVNKFLTFNTLVVNSTLFKLEAVYADVINNNFVSDYAHIAFGFEHTVDAFLGSTAKLGIISEYYYYKRFQKDKLSDLNLYEIFQNDLFLGFRYSFNDVDNSSLIIGAIIDTQYNEQTYSLKYEKALKYGFKFKSEYSHIVPSTNVATPYAIIGSMRTFRLNLTYYF